MKRIGICQEKTLIRLSSRSFWDLCLTLLDIASFQFKYHILDSKAIFIFSINILYILHVPPFSWNPCTFKQVLSRITQWGLVFGNSATSWDPNLGTCAATATCSSVFCTASTAIHFLKSSRNYFLGCADNEVPYFDSHVQKDIKGP